MILTSDGIINILLQVVGGGGVSVNFHILMAVLHTYIYDLLSLLVDVLLNKIAIYIIQIDAIDCLMVVQTVFYPQVTTIVVEPIIVNNCKKITAQEETGLLGDRHCDNAITQ